jgi:hypothetical protein
VKDPWEMNTLAVGDSDGQDLQPWLENVKIARPAFGHLWNLV